ncbi:MAG: hypothetical protein K0U12_03250, partial [Gammaproteobacteria bacterium]|nr:hypothetical protein [Gammaproteobacteria bacterium]
LIKQIFTLIKVSASDTVANLVVRLQPLSRLLPVLNKLGQRININTSQELVDLAILVKQRNDIASRYHSMQMLINRCIRLANNPADCLLNFMQLVSEFNLILMRYNILSLEQNYHLRNMLAHLLKSDLTPVLRKLTVSLTHLLDIAKPEAERSQSYKTLLTQIKQSTQLNSKYSQSAWFQVSDSKSKLNSDMVLSQLLAVCKQQVSIVASNSVHVNSIQKTWSQTNLKLLLPQLQQQLIGCQSALLAREISEFLAKQQSIAGENYAPRNL